MRRLLIVLALLVATPAFAQMPDLRAMQGKPLPMPEIPGGTVVVRVSKTLPMNGVPDVEVTAIITNTGGDSRKRVQKTGHDGRATFEAIAPGSSFEASATVDGEALKTQKFAVPEKPGTRILLVAAMGGGAAPEDEPQFALGATTGRVEAKAGTPAGTLEIALVDEAGKPIAGRLVQLGQVGSDNAVKVTKATSDAAGIVRFQGLATGESTGYAAVIQHQGMRLGTEAFRMEPDKGMRGEIHALGRTADPSVLRFDNRTKIIFEVGEDSLQAMEQLVFKNTSDKMFDGGGDGLLVPLPEGFEGARDIEGSAPIEVRAGQGIAVKTPIAPNTGAMFATQIRVGFVIPAGGARDVEFKQKLPFGMEGGLLLIPSNTNLVPEAPGLKARGEQPDSKGSAVKLYEIDPLPPGATLTITVHGLPALERTGRKVAGVLCLLLVVAAIVGSRKPAHVAAAKADADKLTERREKLFAELVALEQARRQGRASDERRQELIAKLEHVYRELASVSHGDSAGL